MTAEAAHVLAPPSPQVEVQLSSRPDDAWLARYREDEGPLPAVAADVLGGHPAVTFASVRADGSCVAIARVAVDGRWGGLFAVEVEPAHRRRGLASAVVQAAVRWAVSQGARRLYLQVRSGNDGAIAMWSRLGFVRHHDYVYWTAP
jgi:GNAT superfamily N-acetyltransferase